jgi:hypothetical protein
VERIYAQHDTEEDDRAWRKTDLLWKEAQGATIRMLLDDPRTRDTVLRINIAGALRDGDSEMAAKLFMLLSPAARDELIALAEKQSQAGEETD